MDIKTKKKPGLPARLTPMQMKFAELLVYFEGRKYAYECALEAGYSGGKSEGENTLGARVEASRLQNPKLFPHVVKYIGELKEERNKKYEVNYENHITELARIKEAALRKGSFSSAVNAETNRGKAAGLYIDRKIIKHGKLEDMSEEEIELKMKKILDDYAPILNMKTVEAEIEEVEKIKPSKKEKESLN